MSLILEGRVALVTGGESGIGAACAVALARAGAAIGILYWNDEAAALQVRAAVEASGTHGIIVQGDVGDEAKVEAVFAAVTAELGAPDILINSAGLNMREVTVADMELAQWEQLIRTDLTGAFLTSRALVRGLRGSGKAGRIVNISSIHGQAVRAGGPIIAQPRRGWKT